MPQMYMMPDGGSVNKSDYDRDYAERWTGDAEPWDETGDAALGALLRRTLALGDVEITYDVTEYRVKLLLVGVGGVREGHGDTIEAALIAVSGSNDEHTNTRLHLR